jgi:hypothetical protein
VWEALRTELHSSGLEVITVCVFERDGMKNAKQVLDDMVRPSHVCLYDSEHILVAKLGMGVMSMWVWIDEDGMIVRAPEYVHIAPEPFRDRTEGESDGPVAAGFSLEPALAATISKYAERVAAQPLGFADQVRDWAANGAGSDYALSPDELLSSTPTWSLDESTAAAHSELGEHLSRGGYREAAEAHFREAYRLSPENFTYWNHSEFAGAPGRAERMRNEIRAMRQQRRAEQQDSAATDR